MSNEELRNEILETIYHLEEIQYCKHIDLSNILYKLKQMFEELR